MQSLLHKLAKSVRERVGIIRLLLSISILVALFSFVDLGKIVTAFREIGVLPLLSGLGFLFLSQHLSSVRFGYLLADNGFKVPPHDVYRANIFGLIGGMFFFNIFGQGITRSVLLNRYCVPQSTVFFLTLLERATALLVLFTGAVAGAAILFGRLPVSLDNNALYLPHFAIYGVCAAGCAVVFGLTRRQRRHAWLFLRNLMSASMRRLLLVTLAIHAATLASYVIVALNVAPIVRVGSSTAASMITMLVASLPISFAGWGFRELSASLAFSAIGATAEQGFAVGVVIGVLSILALIANAAWLNWGPLFRHPLGLRLRAPAKPVVLERPTYWLVALGATFAAFFDIRIPTNTGELTVNLGDPISIIGGIVMMGLMLQARSMSRFFRVRNLMLAIGGVSTVLAAGLLHSYLIYGPIDWAIYNRFFGWFLLLAYLASGALVVAVSGRLGFSTFSKILASTAVGLVVIDLIGRLLIDAHVLSADALPFYAEGMALNRNAYAFQLLMAFVVLVGSATFRSAARMSRWPTWFAGVLLTGLWLAGSRAAYGALAAAILVLLAAVWGMEDYYVFVRRLGRASIIALVFIALASGAHLSDLTSGAHLGLITNVEPDRIESIVGGLIMWRDHVLLGAGLGAYIHEHILQTKIPLVIHNSELWIAAELGIVGLCVYAYLLWTVTSPAVRTFRAEIHDSHVVLLGCLGAFAIMSLAHDVLYQRLLWIVVGAAIGAHCSLPRPKHPTRSAESSVGVAAKAEVSA
jgi:hypothetical protein